MALSFSALARARKDPWLRRKKKRKKGAAKKIGPIPKKSRNPRSLPWLHGKMEPRATPESTQRIVMKFKLTNSGAVCKTSNQWQEPLQVVASMGHGEDSPIVSPEGVDCRYPGFDNAQENPEAELAQFPSSSESLIKPESSATTTSPKALDEKGLEVVVLQETEEAQQSIPTQVQPLRQKRLKPAEDGSPVIEGGRRKKTKRSEIELLHDVDGPLSRRKNLRQYRHVYEMYGEEGLKDPHITQQLLPTPKYAFMPTVLEATETALQNLHSKGKKMTTRGKKNRYWHLYAKARQAQKQGRQRQKQAEIEVELEGQEVSTKQEQVPDTTLHTQQVEPDDPKVEYTEAYETSTMVKTPLLEDVLDPQSQQYDCRPCKVVLIDFIKCLDLVKIQQSQKMPPSSSLSPRMGDERLSWKMPSSPEAKAIPTGRQSQGKKRPQESRSDDTIAKHPKVEPGSEARPEPALTGVPAVRRMVAKKHTAAKRKPIRPLGEDNSSMVASSASASQHVAPVRKDTLNVTSETVTKSGMTAASPGITAAQSHKLAAKPVHRAKKSVTAPQTQPPAATAQREGHKLTARKSVTAPQTHETQPPVATAQKEGRKLTARKSVAAPQTQKVATAVRKHVRKIQQRMLTGAGANFRCLFCRYTSQVRQSMEDHIYQHLNLVPWYCCHCKVAFGSKSGVMNHTKNLHSAVGADYKKRYTVEETLYYTTVANFLMKYGDREFVLDEDSMNNPSGTMSAAAAAAAETAAVVTKKHEKKSPKPTVTKKKSLEYVEPPVTKRKSLEPAVTKKKSLEYVEPTDVKKKKSLEYVELPVTKRKSLEPAVTKKKSLEPTFPKKKSLEPAVAKKKSLEPAVAKKKSLEPAVTEIKSPEPSKADKVTDIPHLPSFTTDSSPPPSLDVKKPASHSESTKINQLEANNTAQPKSGTAEPKASPSPHKTNASCPKKTARKTSSNHPPSSTVTKTSPTAPKKPTTSSTPSSVRKLRPIAPATMATPPTSVPLVLSLGPVRFIAVPTTAVTQDNTTNPSPPLPLSQAIVVTSPSSVSPKLEQERDAEQQDKSGSQAVILNVPRVSPQILTGVLPPVTSSATATAPSAEASTPTQQAGASNSSGDSKLTEEPDTEIQKQQDGGTPKEDHEAQTDVSVASDREEQRHDWEKVLGKDSGSDVVS